MREPPPSSSMTLAQALELAKGIRAAIPECSDVRLVVQENDMIYRGPEDPWTLDTCGGYALTRTNADTVSLVEIRNGLTRLVNGLAGLVEAARHRE